MSIFQFLDNNIMNIRTCIRRSQHNIIDTGYHPKITRYEPLYDLDRTILEYAMYS